MNKARRIAVDESELVIGGTSIIWRVSSHAIYAMEWMAKYHLAFSNVNDTWLHRVINTGFYSSRLIPKRRTP